jgi:HSP20 family protein
VRITAELPGLDEKDVSLEIANGVLSISGEKKSESEDKAPVSASGTTAALKGA